MKREGVKELEFRSQKLECKIGIVAKLRGVQACVEHLPHVEGGVAAIG